MIQPELDSRRKFAMIPEEMLFDPDIPGEAVKVFGVLHRYGSTPDKCFPSLRVVGEKAGLTPRTVRRHIASLETKGWLRRVNRTRDSGVQDSNAYQLFAQRGGTDTGDRLPGQESPPTRSEMSPPPGQKCPGDPDTDVRQTRAIEREPLNESSPSPPQAAVIDITTREERPPVPTFEDFWAIWPRKVGKKDARKAWDRALKGGTDPNIIIDGARHLAANPPEKQFIKHPSGWINGERWEDEDLATSTPTPQASTTEHAPGAFPEASARW